MFEHVIAKLHCTQRVGKTNAAAELAAKVDGVVLLVGRQTIKQFKEQYPEVQTVLVTNDGMHVHGLNKPFILDQDSALFMLEACNARIRELEQRNAELKADLKLYAQRTAFYHDLSLTHELNLITLRRQFNKVPNFVKKLCGC
jgi:hypothetical protein